MQQSSRTRIWQISVSPGAYAVHLVMGDPGYIDQVNNVDIEGVVRNDPDGQDNFDEYDLNVMVSDGQLTIQPASGSSNAKLCFIEISEIP